MSLKMTDVEAALNVLESAGMVELVEVVTTGDDSAIHAELKGGTQFSFYFDADEFLTETKRD